MDIKGLGDAWAQRLLDAGLVTDVADLYDDKRVNRPALDEILKAITPSKEFQDEEREYLSSGNLLTAIGESKKQPLWRLLTGLGIPLAGSTTCQDLADHFKTLDNLKDASLRDIELVLAGERTVSPHAMKIYDHLREMPGGLFDSPEARGVADYVIALRIPDIGPSRAAQLAKEFRTVEDLKRATLQALSRVFRKEEQRKIAKSVHGFFQDPVTQKVIRKLEDSGVNPKQEEPKGAVHPAFAGKTFVVTGMLKGYKREEIEALIKSLGGKASGSVSSKTDYLVAGEEAGSKLSKAQGLGVKVLSEEDFEQMRGA